MFILHSGGIPGIREFKFAIRAGVVITFNKLDFPELENHDFWWLFAATPLTKGRICELLKIDAKRRAILGLYTPDEGQKIMSDSGLRDQIIECRRLPR